MEVIVPDDQLSLAIGKRGQNVRLASRLVGWKIDVKSESKYSKSLKEGYLSLLRIPGVGEITASLLHEGGILIGPGSGGNQLGRVDSGHRPD